MKRFACVLIAVVCLMPIAGCGKQKVTLNTCENYSIEEVNNQLYVVMDKSHPTDHLQTNQSTSLQFESMDKLIDALTNGKFEDWELSVINNAFPKDKNGIKVFDFQHIYEPIVPSGFLDQVVSWSGENYTYLFEYEDGSSVNVAVCSDSTFDSTKKREYDDFFDRKTILSTEKNEQEGKTIYYYSTSMGKIKEIRFSFDNNGIHYVVDERYNIEYYGGFDLKVSDEIPSQVNLYLEKTDDGQKAIITIFDLTKPVDYSDYSISER